MSYLRGVNISHWLAQFYHERPYAAGWFTRADVAWLRRQGFDHLRIPVDGREWVTADWGVNEGRAAPFDMALEWAQAEGLSVILDMHYLPGASFEPTSKENRLFTDPDLQVNVAKFWRAVATRYAGRGPELRLEILNEPVAKEDSQVNTFNRVMLEAIHGPNPERVVYITSNRWSNFDTVHALEVPETGRIAVTLHYYEPFVFTHQKANWVSLTPEMPLVRFPGVVPDLTGAAPADHWIHGNVGRMLSANMVFKAFSELAEWAAARAPGREIHVGEFGAFRTAMDEDRRYYAAVVRQASEARGFGWAVWDYRGGFAVRSEDGRGTEVLRGIFPDAPAFREQT